ncbi:MAG: VWA domain-containing protein, partial [Planctomycetaceae bacterium]|nr:VWA domain-containing protein [Planctomycetaceae bacterium]
GEMILVLDKSGSMYSRSGNTRPIDQVINATKEVIRSLKPTDRLGVVCFHDHGELICPMTAGEAQQKLLDAVSKVPDVSGGLTDMTAGLKVAMQEAQRNTRDPRGVRFVVLTDGQASDPQETLSYVKTLERQSIAAMGFGTFDFQFMNQVCAPSQGLCKVLDVSNPDALREDFLSEMNTARNTVASNIRLHIEPTSFVRLKKAYVVHPHPTFLGDIAMGTSSRYTLELSILDRVEGIQLIVDLDHTKREVEGEFDAARIVVTYDVPGLDLFEQSSEALVKVEYTSNERDVRITNPNVKKARDKGYDEELRVKYDQAKEAGYEDLAQDTLKKMEKSPNQKFASMASEIREGKEVSSMDLEQETRRKS